MYFNKKNIKICFYMCKCLIWEKLLGTETHCLTSVELVDSNLTVNGYKTSEQLIDLKNKNSTKSSTVCTTGTNNLQWSIKIKQYY